jgi:hypothetical protein
MKKLLSLVLFFICAAPAFALEPPEIVSIDRENHKPFSISLIESPEIVTVRHSPPKLFAWNVAIHSSQQPATAGGGGSALYQAMTFLLDFENNADDTANSYDFTEVNTPTYSSSSPPVGSYYILEPNSGNGYVTLADNDGLDIGDQDYTFVAWIYIDRDNVNPYTKYVATPGEGGIYMTLNQTTFEVRHYQDATAETVQFSTGGAEDEWRHYVLTFDASEEELTLWVSTPGGTFGDSANGLTDEMTQYPAANSGASLTAYRVNTPYGSTTGFDEVGLAVGYEASAAEAEDVWDGDWRP